MFWEKLDAPQGGGKFALLLAIRAMKKSMEICFPNDLYFHGEFPFFSFYWRLYEVPHLMWSKHVQTIISHPPIITIKKLYKPFPNGWFIIV